jgi:acyl-CoA synthetase (NDP forming)
MGMDKSDGLRALFDPASIAVVGASPTNPSAKAALENLLSAGYGGRLAAVNPRYEQVLGVPCSSSLRSLDFIPESIVVSVNKNLVLPVLLEAAELGVPSAVVFGIGFAESGPEGLARQEELKELARISKMALLGPNCQGIINFSNNISMYMDDVKPYVAGHAGLIAQSGSVATALINNQRGVRWRYAISTGNEAVVNASDLLGYMVEDHECKMVSIFLESIRDPQNFFEACDRAADRGLPIVVLKTGITEAGQRAAQAHSGALAVPDKLLDALFKRHGVIRVQTLEQLLETSSALQSQRRPTSGGLATITASGGQIELVLDVAERVGLEHPTLSADTVKKLSEILPDFLPAQNPLDYWGVPDYPTAYPVLNEILALDSAVEIVIAVIDQTDAPTGDGRFLQPFETALRLARVHPEKLFVLLEGVGGVTPPERVVEAAAQGVLILSGFDTGIRALGHLVQHARYISAGRWRGIKTQIETEDLPFDEGAFSGVPAMEFLSKHGVSVAEWRLVRGAEDAVDAAESLGYPVVAKIADMAVTHKTEVGGVRTNLGDANSVRDAVREIFSGGYREVLLQRQLSGVELILGVSRHGELGSFLVIGLGGIWTELLHEVEIVPVGLAKGEADEIIGRLRGKELLEGARGSVQVDRAKLILVIENLDKLALRLGDKISSIDINPVIVTSTGAWAVDALMIPAEKVSPFEPAEGMHRN